MEPRTSPGGADILVLKVDPAGQEIWRQSVGRRGSRDVNHGVVVLGDGRIVIAGYTESWGAGATDFLAAVLDRDGRLLRLETIGGPGEEHVIGAEAGPDGRIWLVGYTQSQADGGKDVLVAQMDAAGGFDPGVLILDGGSSETGTAIHPLGGGRALIGGYGDASGSEDAFVALLTDLEFAEHPAFRIERP